MVSKITLVTADNKSHQIDRDVALRSLLLKNMLEDLEHMEEEEDGDGGPRIPLPNVEGKVLEKVLEYCTHHRNDSPVTANEDFDAYEATSKATRKLDEADEWDLNFIRIDNESLFELILAANYLDIKDLLDLGCRSVAEKIKGKGPEQIRSMFNIENDFSATELEQIRKENAWCLD